MTNDPVLDVHEESLGYLIHRTALRLKCGLRRAFVEKGLDFTPEQFAALALVGREGGLSQVEIAEKCLTDKTTVTRVVDRLEKRGLMVRRRDPDDRRSYRLHLTKAGLALAGQLTAVVEEFRNRVFGDFPREELDAMRRFMETVQARVP